MSPFENKIIEDDIDDLDEDLMSSGFDSDSDSIIEKVLNNKEDELRIELNLLINSINAANININAANNNIHTAYTAINTAIVV